MLISVILLVFGLLFGVTGFVACLDPEGRGGEAGGGLLLVSVLLIVLAAFRAIYVVAQAFF